MEVTWNDDQPFSIVPGNSANYMGNFYFRVIPDDGYGFSDNLQLRLTAIMISSIMQQVICTWWKGFIPSS